MPKRFFSNFRLLTFFLCFLNSGGCLIRWLGWARRGDRGVNNSGWSGINISEKCVSVKGLAAAIPPEGSGCKSLFLSPPASASLALRCGHIQVCNKFQGWGKQQSKYLLCTSKTVVLILSCRWLTKAYAASSSPVKGCKCCSLPGSFAAVKSSPLYVGLFYRNWTGLCEPHSAWLRGHSAAVVYNGNWHISSLTLS